MKRNINRVLVPVVISLLLIGCGDDNNSVSSSSDSATYTLTFKSDWSAANFPTNYPAGVAHFSPLIGMTHNSSASLFTSGSLATSGVEIVAETGGTDTIKTEIGDIQNLGNSQSLIEGSGLPFGQTETSVSFTLDKSFSLVSVITMIAPSPDWFIGVDSLDLFESGSWKDEVVVQLKVYDSGTDDGTVFTSANADSSPKQNIALLTSNSADTDFEDGIHRSTSMHIGTFTFTRQ
ncbi:spondin domain-containing protein [Vibrio sp. HN007]|uniref:spondin domain-containing protein n=1 Tax=Vibrio iocasae TaxID=3098914 RepID=UPI0035D49FF4